MASNLLAMSSNLEEEGEEEDQVNQGFARFAQSF